MLHGQRAYMDSKDTLNKLTTRIHCTVSYWVCAVLPSDNVYCGIFFRLNYFDSKKYLSDVDSKIFLTPFHRSDHTE